MSTTPKMPNDYSANDVLDNFIMKAGSPSPRAINELDLREAIMLSKEVLIDRLTAYISPTYKERQSRKRTASSCDNVKTVEMIGVQIKETLGVCFSSTKPAVFQLYTLLILPILDDVSRTGIHEYISEIDMTVVDDTADDVFGHMMRYVKKSTIEADVDSARRAADRLNVWSRVARSTRKDTK